MRFVDEFQDPQLARSLVHAIADASTRTASVMEFCGGHTHAILRYGIRDLLPKNITLSSGPGCPVCVTAPGDIDRAAGLALERGIITATYGDLIRVPGSTTSLQQIRARGGDVRVVYSALDALQLAAENPTSLVVLPGIGFETTAPTVAATILKAERQGLTNFRVFPLLKLTAPIMQALLSSGETRIDGIICPGHVSVITGTHPYDFIPREFDVACAVAGFEPLDILGAVRALTVQLEQQHPRVENTYPRAVKPEGNRVALATMNEVFEPCAAQWRGIGTVPESGLRLRSRFSLFDATPMLQNVRSDEAEPPGCKCGDILRGIAAPVDCAHFGSACTPEHPIGPCMVSAEGSCAAYYAYTLHN